MDDINKNIDRLATENADLRAFKMKVFTIVTTLSNDKEMGSTMRSFVNDVIHYEKNHNKQRESTGTDRDKESD
jgi:hypothetical protein